jgi:CRISPR-associated protein Csd2
MGNAHAHQLFDRVKHWRRSGDDLVAIGDQRLDNTRPPRSFADYAITVERDGLPDGVEVLEDDEVTGGSLPLAAE